MLGLVLRIVGFGWDLFGNRKDGMAQCMAVKEVAPLQGHVQNKSQRRSKTINVAVSSRALFQLEDEHDVWKDPKQGPEAYVKVQKERENTPLEKGTAYPFIKVLKYVNDQLKKIDKDEKELFEVVLLSHNHAGTGIRLLNSIEHNELDIKRMGLTDGNSPVNYLEGFDIALFLTSYEEDVEAALQKGFAAATIVNQPIDQPVENQLRIAFDLDAVVFDDKSEQVYKEKGLQEYIDHEKGLSETPLDGGPLKPFAQAIGRMQDKFRKNKDKLDHVDGDCLPIRTYFVTARSVSVGKRALRTLRSWDLEVNETFLLSGAPKDGILKAINPHIFFDDTQRNIDDARKANIPAGHVKYISK